MRHQLRRPVLIGVVNWVGLWTLYSREVLRFTKIALQTLVAPMITSVLFLMVFSVAVGDHASFAGNVDFTNFLIPGLVMMSVLQNAFASTSTSLVVSKVPGNIVDLLMPPLGPGELLVSPGRNDTRILRWCCDGSHLDVDRWHYRPN